MTFGISRHVQLRESIMSKKSRRQRRPNLPVEAFNVPTAAPKPRTAAGAAVAPVRETAHAAAAPVNWQEEYGEVLGDLKRTAIYASILMVAMIALSFIIR